VTVYDQALACVLIVRTADFGYCAQIDKKQSKRTTLAGTPCWVGLAIYTVA